MGSGSSQDGSVGWEATAVMYSGGLQIPELEAGFSRS